MARRASFQQGKQARMRMTMSRRMIGHRLDLVRLGARSLRMATVSDFKSQMAYTWSTTIIPFHRRQLFLSSRLGKFFHLFGVMIAPVRWNGVFGALAPKTEWNRTGGADSWLARCLGFLRPDAFAVELQNDGVMDEAVNGRHGGHRVLKDLIPLGEHQVAADHHAAPLIALG